MFKPKATSQCRTRRVLTLMAFAVLLTLMLALPSLVVLFRSVGVGNDDDNNGTRARGGAASAPAFSLTLPTGDEHLGVGVGVGDGDGDTAAEECSCQNSRAPRHCCRRQVLRAHKFGYVLAASLFSAPRRAGDVELTWSIEPSALFPDGTGNGVGVGSSSTSPTDYRHVVTVRNYMEAFVSGYLYHKTGRECWKGTGGGQVVGAPVVEGLMGWPEPVDALRNATYPDLGFYPPPNNRSLCRYLRDESEEHGMKVYIAFALKHWYSGLVTYLQIAAQRKQLGVRKSMFVCLENLSDPTRERGLYHEMIDFLYPGGHAYPYPRNVTVATGSAQPYSGGHATDPDPDLRRRLLGIVRALDRDAFRRHLSSVDNVLGCNGTIRR